MSTIRRLATDELGLERMAVLRELFTAAWGNDPDEAFTQDDWDHALGGVHFILEQDGAILAHASVVERALHTSGYRLATGYVEAVATWPIHQRLGHGSAVMREVNRYIDEAFELGALGSGRFAFYQRLGWVVWRGPTFVRTDTGTIPTPEEDGFVLVRLTPASPQLDLAAPISCDWRPGDAW